MFKHPQIRLHFIILLWGFTAIIGKLITIDALPLVVLRMFFAFVSIGLFLALTGIGFKVSKKELIQYGGIGVLIGIHWMLFFKAIKISNVSVVLTTLSTGAFFSAFTEPLFFKRKIRALEIILALIIVCCIGFIFQATPKHFNLGIVLGVLCSLVASIFSVLNAVLLKKGGDARKMMFYQMGSGSLFVFLLLLFTTNNIFVPLIGNDIFWLILLGVVFTAYPMIESVQLFKYISPYTLTLSINLEPIYGIIFAYFIFGESEKMSPMFYLVVVIMILVLLINGIVKNKQRASSVKY